MTDKEWIDGIKNVPTEELFERLEFIGCDGYYGDIWEAIIEELKNRVRPQGEWKMTMLGYMCPKCSDCSQTIKRNFCPNCGIRMIGDSDE